MQVQVLAIYTVIYCDIGIIFYHIWCHKHRSAVLPFSLSRKVGCHVEKKSAFLKQKCPKNKKIILMELCLQKSKRKVSLGKHQIPARLDTTTGK